MRPFETVLAAAVVGLGCFVGIEAASMPATSHEAVVSSDTYEGTLTRRLARSPHTMPAIVVEGRTTLFGRLAPAELQRRVAQGAEGTYISELLAVRDSALTRWPDRTVRPVRVFIGTSTLDGWRDDFSGAVQSAFDTWSDVGIPVHFTFVTDSSHADVRVRFRESFASGISGKTVWSRDARWWLITGDIDLALAHPSGGYVDVPQMRAIALHEVGHLLGLDHTASKDNIMAPRVRVRDLSPEDRATIRLLYSVPAGSLRN